jgi:hypothetical protein
MSPQGAARQPPCCHARVPEPEPRGPSGLVKALGFEAPRAFHGFDGLVRAANMFCRSHARGTRPLAFAWVVSKRPSSCLRARLTPGLPRRTACAFQRDFPSFRSLAAIRFQLSGTLLRGERHPVSSRPAAFHVARRCALVGPCGLPRSHRQGASNPLLQPTFAPRAPVANITFGDCPPGSAGNPPLSAFEIARERGVATLLRELCRTAFRSSGLQQPRA